jgi:hypothetical protein
MKWYSNAALFLLSAPYCYGAMVVQGNDPDAPKGFLTPVTTKVLDSKTGTMYVGIQDNAAPDQSGTFAVSRAYRPDPTIVNSFAGIALDNLAGTPPVTLTNQTIEFLTLAQEPNAASILGIVTQDPTSTLVQEFIIALPTTGALPLATANLNDASGINVAGGIIGLAARSHHFLIAVRPNTGNFGDPNGGLALVILNFSSTGIFNALDILDAPTGALGNRALELQANSPVLTGGTNPVTFSSTPADINRISIYYDEVFDRFYIGTRIITGTTATDIGKAVATARVDIPSGGELLLEPIVANGAISGANEIVVAEGSSVNLGILKAQTLHASTGPSYLIVNGSQGTTDIVGNLIFAMPLVNDPTNLPLNGTLAKYNAPLVNNVFVTPATAGGDLLIATDSPAMVGAGPAPLAASDTISDMVVVGDTVYISIAKEQSATNDTGIWYSQAEFDDTGKILRWTPWTKRVVPINLFPNNLLPGNVVNSGAVKFFDIDAKTGNVWIVEADTGQVVGITSWSTGSDPNQLIARLSAALTQGSYSALDLDQATNNFSGNTNYRYALFGGVNQVIFALTSQQNPGETRQIVTTDFSVPQNFLSTNCLGNVSALEYGRRPTGTANNYFFAGTEQGLFVFASPLGAGFDVNTLALLTAPPFSTNSWQKAGYIPGSVIDIKSSGNGNLYVLTLELTGAPLNPFKNTIYSIPFTTNISTMFAPGNIRTIGVTGVGAFANVSEFFGMQIVATGTGVTPQNTEQLILATNQGLFHSTAVQPTGIAGAVDQTTAVWTVYPGTAGTCFWGVAGMNTPIRNTVWPFSAQDENNIRSFDRGSIHQLSANSNDGITPLFGGFIPANFNAESPAPQFQTLYPINAFWSDGARRFFVANRTIDPGTQNKLSVVPFDVVAWDCVSQGILNDPTTTVPEHFYWVEQIGATGFLLAGGGKGVIGIQ